MNTSKIELIKDFHVPELGTNKKIWVYLPPNYSNTALRFPVLYMHDGQNLFFDEQSFVGAWKVHDTLDRFYAQNKMRIPIVVGIENGHQNRWNEYSPWKHDQKMSIGWGEKGQGGQGDLYADFIVNTLKPYIDNNYRTKTERSFTSIAGSSMGGLISLYIGLKHKETFSNIMALSPAFWFAKQELIQFIKSQGAITDLRIYMDVGRKEGPKNVTEAYVNDAIEIHHLLQSQIDDNKNNTLFIDDEGIHHESAWKRRFPMILKWLHNLEVPLD